MPTLSRKVEPCRDMTSTPEPADGITIAVLAHQPFGQCRGRAASPVAAVRRRRPSATTAAHPWAQRNLRSRVGTQPADRPRSSTYLCSANAFHVRGMPGCEMDVMEAETAIVAETGEIIWSWK